MADIEFDDAMIEEMLNSVEGPVGQFLTEKMIELTALVGVKAPIQKPENYSWGKHSTSYMPRSMGYLKGTVRPHMGYTKSGQLFAGTNAAYGPSLFLERGGGRYGHARLIPFMTEALYAVTVD